VSSIISVHKDLNAGKKLLTPVLKSAQGELYIRSELYRMFKSIGLEDIGFLDISLAYEKARKYVKSVNEEWKKLYQNGIKDLDDIHIMLLGRPYTILSPAMNNSIPEIIEKMGIMTFYMDMLPSKQSEALKAEDLIKTIKWRFASKILYAAEVAAKSDKCYPVLITSFKCSPDSFVI
jgi:predicted nucleotide-binding protein (sugar kinase/HSP70/actin superfamily)